MYTSVEPNMRLGVILCSACALIGIATPESEARTWTDSTGRYTLEAELVDFNDHMVILQRADHESVALPIDALSVEDQVFLNSKAAQDFVHNSTGGFQTWTLRDGTKVVGRIVDYADHDITLQRRRGRIYVNDRVLKNLPKFYQDLIPKIVAQQEGLQRADRRSLESWLVRQRGEPRTFHVKGVVLEAENGDEFSLPFFLFAESDQTLLKQGWDLWLATLGGDDYRAHEDQAFLLKSLAAARQHDRQVKREIAQLQLKLQAIQAGVTSLWEVTLYPSAGHHRPPQWVVVTGRDSRQATENALKDNPGYVAGPVRRVAGR
jgi:SLA1 homology domain 1, SHD1